jgi:hypothetical protein
MVDEGCGRERLRGESRIKFDYRAAVDKAEEDERCEISFAGNRWETNQEANMVLRGCSVKQGLADGSLFTIATTR